MNRRFLCADQKTIQSLISNETEYEYMIGLLNSLLDSVRDDADHPLYSMIAVVGDLIENYEMNLPPLNN
jgi:HTH-type transcriptional regulator/antitoxin HigA